MGLTALPTNEDGSLGRDKVDLDAVPELQHYVPAQEYNNLVDAVVDLAEEVGLSDGSTPGSLVKRIGDIEGGGGDLILEWNGVDISQFAAAETWNSAAQGGGNATPGTLSVAVDAAAPGGKVLRYETNGGGGAWLWLLADALEVRRFVVVLDFWRTNVGMWTGVALVGDDTAGVHAYGLGFGPGGNINMSRVDDGTWVASGTTPSGPATSGDSASADTPGYGAQIILEVSGDKVAGLAPRFTLYGNDRAKGNSTNGLNLSRERWDDYLGSAPPAPWETTEAAKVGLFLRSNNNGDPGTFMELSGFRVLKHPADR